MNTLGQRIKIARGKTSQAAFAEQIDVSKGSLGFYERDENLPNTEVALKICSATGVSIEWLLTGDAPLRPGNAEATHNGESLQKRVQELEKELAEARAAEREARAAESRALQKLVAVYEKTVPLIPGLSSDTHAQAHASYLKNGGNSSLVARRRRRKRR